MAIETDPFTQVYDALWSLPWKRKELCRLVKPGNRITFSGQDRDPLRPEVSTANLPELTLIPISGQPHVQATSNSSFWLARFEWQLATGDKRVNRALYRVTFELLRALANWLTVLQALKWKSKPFVVVQIPRDERIGVTERDLNRGIQGWSSLWSCEVKMFFATADLIAE